MEEMTNNLFINLTDPAIFESFGGEKYWEKVDAANGGVILNEDEDTEDFYFIFSGSVSIDKSLNDGKGGQKHLANLLIGDFFGEGSLLSDRGRSATVKATSDCVLLKLSKKNFDAFVVEDPQAAVGLVLGIVKVLNVRLQNMNERLIALHNIAHIASVEAKNDTQEALNEIIEQLVSVLHHGGLVLFGMDGLPKLQSKEMDAGLVEAFQMQVPEVANKLQGGEVSVRQDENFYCAVKNPQGQLTGIMAVVICDKCEEQDARLLTTVSEKLGQIF